MRVLLVDDSQPFRRAARSLLTRRGYEVVGEASTATIAIAKAVELLPGAALVDLQLPDGSGYEVSAQLARLIPPIAVLLMSTHDDGLCHTRAAVHGARGFVLKSDLARCDLARFWSGE